jgi:glycerophosphoryl diester phosphodiesterase
MPEASLPAYSNAVAMANDIVKLDVQFTKDGVAVMGHDVTLKRNMGWNVNIADLTYAEILEKGRFLEGGKPGTQRIMRLDQALAIVKPVPEFWIDFKDGKRYQPEQADKVVAAFAAAGIDLSRVMVATFATAALKDFKERYPQVRRVAHYSVKTKVNVDHVFSYSDELGLYGLNMPVLRRQTSVQDIAALKKRGLWVSLWFVQDAETATCYGESNADAFVTDYVSIVRETLGLGQ